jgi:hypothetical protein
MTTTILIPLVGAHFRPPASTLLAHLPAGSPVELIPEPENPYDASAVGVWISGADIPESDSLRDALPASGHDLGELRAGERLQLGYLCSAANTRQLAKCPAGEVWKSNAEPIEVEAGGKLLFSSTGQALVSVSTSVSEVEDSAP